MVQSICHYRSLRIPARRPCQWAINAAVPTQIACGPLSLAFASRFFSWPYSPGERWDQILESPFCRSSHIAACSIARLSPARPLPDMLTAVLPPSTWQNPVIRLATDYFHRFEGISPWLTCRSVRILCSILVPFAFERPRSSCNYRRRAQSYRLYHFNAVLSGQRRMPACVATWESRAAISCHGCVVFSSFLPCPVFLTVWYSLPCYPFPQVS